MSIISNLIRKSVKNDGPLNILSFWYDGRFDVELTKTGHKFFGSQDTSCYPWPAFSRPCSNLHIFNNIGEAQTIDFDLILFNNREVHAQFFPLVRNFHVPVLIIDHDITQANPFFLAQIKKSTPFPSICTSDATAAQFGGQKIYYGIEQKVGQYEMDIDILICGDFSEGDYFFINKLKSTFPTMKLIGRNNLPFNETVESYDDYKNLFKRSRVFLNIAPQRNLGYEILWALQYKCLVVGNNQPMYDNILNTSNSICTETIDEAVHELVKLGSNHKKLDELALYNTDLTKFNEETFINQWNEVFESYRNKAYIE